jgi:tungstate transport system substrate-binding protein
MKRWGLAALAALVVLNACAGQVRVIVAAGTTLVDSGVVGELVLRYEADHPDTKLSVVGESTARILELGRKGGADLLITHAPDLEAEFVAEGLSARYQSVMESRFILAGPVDAVAKMPGAIDEAMQEISRREALFVSRSDGSGTNHKELELWDRAGIEPTGLVWYLETGQGMGFTLQVADQRGAFVVTEIGVFLAAAPFLSLAMVEVADDPVLVNPYQVIVVKGSPAESAASAFASWLLSEDGRQEIVSINNELFGQVIYQPVES